MNFDVITDSEAKAIGAEMAATLAREALSYCGTITTKKFPHLGGEIGNGTFFIVNSGDRLFGVTAAHVALNAEKFEKTGSGQVTLSEKPVLGFFKRIISIDRRNDIATFRIDDDEVSQLRTQEDWAMRANSNWPPICPAEECHLIFCGFPGQLRTKNSSVIQFRSAVSHARVTSVSDWRLSVAREHEFEIRERNTAPAKFDWGGISGGPMLSLVRVNGVLRLFPCGVVVDASTDWEIVFGSRIETIQQDGSISSDVL